MKKWIIEEVPINLLREIDLIDGILSGSCDQSGSFIPDHIKELRLNMIWVRYLMETSEASSLIGNETFRIKMEGYISILDGLATLYYDLL